MTQDEKDKIVKQNEAILKKTGVSYQLKSGQPQANKQVRFLGVGSNHSLNLCLKENREEFMADFVFKGSDPSINTDRLKQFIKKHGGEIGPRATSFARIYIPFSEEKRLIQIIQDYWEIDLSGEGSTTATKTLRVRKKTKDYTPNENDYESALRQLAAPGEKIPISIIEDRIEKIMKEKGIQLSSTWRKGQ